METRFVFFTNITMPVFKQFLMRFIA